MQVVAMVNAGLIALRASIPIIMGANIGTTVTNTIVAFGQAQDSDEFKLAFAAATVHDFFNWLSVLVQLPIELLLHPLERLTGAMVAWMEMDADAKMFNPLHVITEPFTAAIIQAESPPTFSSTYYFASYPEILR